MERLAIETQEMQMESSPNQIDMTEEELSSMLTAQTIVIDYDVVDRVGKSGFPNSYVVNSLNAGDLNHATTSYYLMGSQACF